MAKCERCGGKAVAEMWAGEYGEGVTGWDLCGGCFEALMTWLGADDVARGPDVRRVELPPPKYDEVFEAGVAWLESEPALPDGR